MDDEQTRRARRQFIRAHHPDLGGDPAAFIAGLADFTDEHDVAPISAARVHVIPSQRWPQRAGRVVTGLAQRIRGRSPRPPRVR